MKWLGSVVVGIALIGLVSVSPAQAQSRGRGFAHGPSIVAASSMHLGSMSGDCSCMPMRSRYVYGYANPGYQPGYGVPYVSGIPYAPNAPYFGGGSGYLNASIPDSGYGDTMATSMQSVSSLPIRLPDNTAQTSAVTVDGNRLSWPVGLRVLAPTNVGGLRQQVQDLFEALSVQRASAGQVSPQLAAEANHALDRLQRLVNQDKMKAGLPQAVNQEAERFVAKLRNALNRLQQTA